MKVKLKDFYLNKQSLKRKIKKTNNDTVEVVKLLNKRGTTYEINELLLIIDTLYTNNDVDVNKTLSRYYSKYNKKKYKEILQLIDIKKNKNINNYLHLEISELIKNIYNSPTTRNILTERLISIANDYSLRLDDVENIFYKKENEWIKKIKNK